MAETIETKVDVEGDMEVPTQQATRFSFDINSFPKVSNLPSPMEIFQMSRQYLRPWSEFFNTANFKTAVSMPRLTNRVIRNLKYFQSNYIVVFVVMMIYCLVTSPLILIVLAGAAFASHKIRSSPQSITICGQTLTTRQQVILLNAGMIPVLFLVGAGSVLFWTLGATFFLVGFHSVFYNIDAIVTEDTDNFLAQVV